MLIRELRVPTNPKETPISLFRQKMDCNNISVPVELKVETIGTIVDGAVIVVDVAVVEAVVGVDLVVVVLDAIVDAVAVRLGIGPLNTLNCTVRTSVTKLILGLLESVII